MIIPEKEEKLFNTNKRIKNVMLSSSSGVIEQVMNYGLAFLYRTIFLSVLSKEYLGISGLFTNILQVFSLAELGIGSVISYRMYSPVKAQNIKKCAQLLYFYRKIYRIISIIVLLLGVLFLPFLWSIIKDPGEIPSDVNIYAVYSLFVIQSVSSYFFVYYQSLLSADQKGYEISAANTIYFVTSYFLRIILLLMTHQYMLDLIIGIISNLFYNFILSIYIRKKYSEITKGKHEKLPHSEQIDIFNDTAALMCHKIGYTIVNSTDSILLSQFIGVAVVGLYSNYSMIAVAVDAMLNKIFGSFVPTIGNYLIDSSNNDKFESYKRLRFVNFWAASFSAICVYVLIDPFIRVWLGNDYLLDKYTTIIISANILINSSRIINSSYVNGAGLFVKDRIRPLFQAFLNLAFSIFFVKRIGISGVFLGTILSTLTTVWWREGIILYRYIFQRSVSDYYVANMKWILITIATAFIIKNLTYFLPYSLIGFICKVIICVLGINLIYTFLFFTNENFVFFKNLVLNRIQKH